jgi:hypothetical protein
MGAIVVNQGLCASETEDGYDPPEKLEANQRELRERAINELDRKRIRVCAV